MTPVTAHDVVRKSESSVSLIAEELARLGSKGDGILYPEDVVRAAKSTKSPLHNHFDWNDGVAAEKWRLEQARRLIRVYVTVIDADGPKEIRGYVSLSPDRMGKGGYRTMVDVLKNIRMRGQLLDDAIDDLQRLRTKYRALKELADVFAAISEIELKATGAISRR